LVKALQAAGHTVTALVRNDAPGMRWDEPAYRIREPERLAAFDAVVHLGGETIVGRWSVAKKERIRASRVKSTHALSTALAQLEKKPSVFICASATGFYSDRGNERVDESSPIGKGFLAEVCRDWEAATAPAQAAGIRVVNLRYGMLLSPAGGALKTMLPPFKMGLGGKVGPGTQYMAWASLEDAVQVVLFALENADLSGPVNVVAPEPCTNLTFTKTLGRVLRRPTVFPVPAFAARLAFGEMADALLMASQRVVPQKLIDHGYAFRNADLEQTLRDLIEI
jgi:uncharacterized protein (TIGR01777 family)